MRHQIDLPDFDQGARQRLVRAYLSDERPSTTVLSRRFGRSVNTIKNVLRDEGVLRTGIGRPPHATAI